MLLVFTSWVCCNRGEKVSELAEKEDECLPLLTEMDENLVRICLSMQMSSSFCTCRLSDGLSQRSA